MLTLTHGPAGCSDNDNIGSILSNKINALPRTVQFLSLALSVFFFFGIHNVLQEAMINTEGFTFGMMLGWMEVLGVTLCSALERSTIPYIGNGEGKRPRMAPWQAYPPLTICLLMSSSLASWSLNYINFPTKVVFRSCKLLPTMVLAYVMGNAKQFSNVEVGSALAVCAGLITFAAGDWSLSNPQFHPFGLTLVTLSVFADAVLPNAQDKLFRTYDVSKSEVMFFTNIYTLVVQTGSALLSGDLVGMFCFAMGKSKVLGLMGDTNSTILQNDMTGGEENMMVPQESGEIRREFILYTIAYILISYFAVSAHTAVVKKFGGVAAVFLGTARKGTTLILSFVLFPKESNWKYAAGAILVLGGLAVASLEKLRDKQSAKILCKTSVRAGAEPIIQLPGIPHPKPDDHLRNGNGTSERQPLINLDAELGRSPSTVINGPERRR